MDSSVCSVECNRDSAVSVQFQSETNLSEDQIRNYFTLFGAVEKVKTLSSTMMEVNFQNLASTAIASKYSIHYIDGVKAAVHMFEPELAR